MRWYWSITSVPELADLPLSQRMRLVWRCYWSLFGLWQIWVAMFVTGMCPPFGVVVSGLIFGVGIQSAVSGMFIGGLVGGLGMLQAASHFIRPSLLTERGRTELGMSR
jgi:hypothetical protein